MDVRTELARRLEAVRRRSLDLLAPLDEHDLIRQHSPIMSPLVWDLAHVGNYEELWLLRAVTGAEPLDASLDDMYDAFRHPRPNRPALPLLGPPEARRYIANVRDMCLDALEKIDLDDLSRPLVSKGFVYGMVVQHEHQHDETMLATLQLMDGENYRPLAAAPPEPPARHPLPDEVLVPAGPFVMGTDDETWVYDNERPSHVVELDDFWIDTIPVTNARYIEFINDGGYHHDRWWSAEGWTWRKEAGLEHPEFWERDPESGSWWRRRFGWHEEVPPDEPVQHVCWHEASAFAAWAGKRLPSEAEWEKAASWGPDNRKRRYPWGDGEPTSEVANLGQRHFRPAPVGAYPGGASAWGCQQMVGDVWEWTSSEFAAYPGFSSFPYREYSEVFFDSGYRVLRGGSWATDPCAIRTTFRNWDLPIRRQIFAGFRCARDAERRDTR